MHNFMFANMTNMCINMIEPWVGSPHAVTEVARATAVRTDVLLVLNRTPLIQHEHTDNPDDPKRHQNMVVGLKCQHEVKTRLANLRQAPTASNISALGIYRSTTAAHADVIALEKSLQNYWQQYEIGDGEFPEGVHLHIGSKIKLWAQGSHDDIGYAVGHPCLDGTARYTRAHRSPCATIMFANMALFMFTDDKFMLTNHVQQQRCPT